MFINSKRQNRWKHSFENPQSNVTAPKEYICPISNAVMQDPVIIPTGQTFDRISTQVCKDQNLTWTLQDNTVVDFSTSPLFPNLSLKSTIQNWVSTNLPVHPPPPDYTTILNTIMQRERDSVTDLIRAVKDKPTALIKHAESDIGPTRFYGSFSGSVSDEPVKTPLPFKTRPSCLSSSEIDTSFGLASLEEEEIVRRIESEEVFEQEEGVVMLRRITKVDEESRVVLCSARVVSGLKELMVSRYANVQVNAVASLVNLSLERCNKLKLVRAGVVPVLVDLLKGGGGIEAQEHAAGALFSLAIEDENKMAIGVLGGLPALMYALRSESERSRNDSALALYHLSLVKGNQVKLVKLGAVGTLLGMVRSEGLGGFLNRVLLVLCNLAICDEGRSAMLDGNAVECFVGMLRRGEFDSENTRENCVAALYALSHGSLRFKGLAKEARAVEVLKEIEEKGTDRAREKAKRMLQMLRGQEEGENGKNGDWDRVLESGGFSGFSRTRNRLGGARNAYGTNSNNF